MSTRKNLNYVSRACDFCKGRHKKCDGGRPCFACKQRNRSCVYSKKVKKRGPKPKVKSCALPVEMNAAEITIPLNPPASPVVQAPSPAPMVVVKKEIPSRRFSIIEQINKQRNSWKRKASFCHANCENPMNIQTMLSSFMRELLWYPHIISFAPSRVEEYWRIAQAPIYGSSEEQLSSSFLYCTLFAHGSSLTGNEVLATEFANKAFVIMNHLFLTQCVLQKADIAEKLLQGLVLFVPFVAATHPCRARAAIMHAFTLCNTSRDVFTPTLIYRVYVHMVAVSANLYDREHWFFMANKLGSRAATLENRVVMALTLSFSALDENRDTPSLFLSNLQEARDISQDNILRHYVLVMNYLNECEEVLHYCANTLDYHLGPNKYDLNIVQSFQAVLYCCKCYVHSLYSSNLQQTLQYAHQAIVLASSISEVSIPILASLAHVLQFLQETQNYLLFAEGLKVLQSLSRKAFTGHHTYEHALMFIAETPEIAPTIIRAICSSPSPLSFYPGSLRYIDTSILSSVHGNRLELGPLDPLFPAHHDTMLLDEPIDPKPYHDHSHDHGDFFMPHADEHDNYVVADAV